MKKQIFIIILLLMGGVSGFGQFRLDGGVNSLRLRTDGIDRMYIAPNTAVAPVLPGNVGIGTLTPPAKLTVAGDMALQKIQRETGSGGYNDYDRQDASIAIFENGGTIGGIQGGSKGQMLYVLCGYGTNQSALTIRHDSPLNPTASNRILTHTGADFVITGGAGGVLLIYDDTKARWRIVETPSGSGTAGWGLTGNAGTNPATQFIGTTDAQDLVFKTNNITKFNIDGSTPTFVFRNFSTSFAPTLQGQQAGGTSSSPTPIVNNLVLFSLSATGYTGSSYLRGSGITFSATENWNSTANGGRISFLTQENNNLSSYSVKMTINHNGNVGIGTTTPDAKLEIAGNYSISSKAQMTGNQNNFNLGGKSVLHVSGGGAYTLTGIAGGTDGMLLHIYVSISTDLILADVSASSLTGNKIVTGSNADIIISQGGGATLIYDADATVWRVIGIKN